MLLSISIKYHKRKGLVSSFTYLYGVLVEDNIIYFMCNTCLGSLQVSVSRTYVMVVKQDVLKLMCICAH